MGSPPRSVAKGRFQRFLNKEFHCGTAAFKIHFFDAFPHFPSSFWLQIECFDCFQQPKHQFEASEKEISLEHVAKRLPARNVQLGNKASGMSCSCRPVQFGGVTNRAAQPIHFSSKLDQTRDRTKDRTGGANNSDRTVDRTSTGQRTGQRTGHRIGHRPGSGAMHQAIRHRHRPGQSTRQ